jgi:hypothetical protein
MLNVRSPAAPPGVLNRLYGCALSNAIVLLALFLDLLRCDGVF